MKVWITKYALSSGVVIAEGQTRADKSVIVVRGHPFFKPDWHTTEEEANKRVLELIRRKRKAHVKALDKLLALEKSLRLGRAR